MTIGTTPGAIPIATSSASGAMANPLSAFPMEHNMYKGEHYHFFCKPEGGGLPPGLYQHVLSQATNHIWIWDPFFRHTDAAIFKELTHNGIEIKIITDQGGPNLEDFKNDCVTIMETAMDAAKRAGSSLRITRPKGAGFAAWKTHDRFLFVDDEVYLIGSSVNYYTAVHDSSGAYHVVSETDKELLKKAFELYWMKLDDGTNVAVHSF